MDDFQWSNYTFRGEDALEANKHLNTKALAKLRLGIARKKMTLKVNLRALQVVSPSFASLIVFTFGTKWCKLGETVLRHS